MPIETEKLITEKINKETIDIDKKTTIEILKTINGEDKTVAYAVEKQLKKISVVVDNIVLRLKEGGRLIYIGAGTSGRLAILDAAECPPTFGTNSEMVLGLIAGGEKALFQALEGVEDSIIHGEEQLKEINLNSRDVVIGIAASGRTPYVIGGLVYAKKVGCYTASISCTDSSQIGQVADDAIDVVVGPEVISGSTRLKAGTAQKMVLNMISTSTMVLLGKVYGNLMVDLQANNSKLVDRAKRIVMAATDLDYYESEKVLESVNYNTKLAIMMIKGGVKKEEAEDLLQKANGFIREALLLQKNREG